MKKILITGGGGYLGSNLATSLIQAGYSVTVVDLMKYSTTSLAHLFNSKKFNLIKGDARDKRLMKKILKKSDIIFPLAGLVGAPLCEKFKKDAISTNLNAVEMLCSNISKSQKIIFPTTNSGYGIGEKNSFCNEESPLRPVSLYGRTKVQAEEKILERENSISYRLATVFGYSYRMGSDLLVNFYVNEALNKKLLKIFEPNFRRNFIHVSDVTKGFIFGIKNFELMRGNIFNLGLSNANVTKMELAKKIKKNIKDLRIETMERKDPDKRDYYVSNRKIEKLGFKAKFSLDEGIRELISFFTFNKNKIKNNY